MGDSAPIRVRAKGTEPRIDADVHCVAPDTNALEPYLPRHWQEFVGFGGFKFREAIDHCFPPLLVGSAHLGSIDSVRQEVLEDASVMHAVLNCYMGIEALQNVDLARSLATASNEWIADRWLSRGAGGSKLKASIIVAAQDPEAAGEEIRKRGSHAQSTGFVQVLLPVHSEQLYGQKHYFPIFEAASEFDLPIAIHYGGLTVNPPTPSGWPTYFIDEYVGMSQLFQSQLLSLIAEGVFERFPTLRIVLIESGFTWLPSLMWRLDKEWKGFRREVPWLKELPSTYIRQHVRATVQPIDGPMDGGPSLRVVFDQIGSAGFLMYGSDYPHSQGTQREMDAFLDVLSAEEKQMILLGNAKELYRL